jgi:hypothetical protein
MNKPTSAEMVKFKADLVLRRAIKLRAALQGTTLQEVIVEALRAVLSDEINEVRQRGLVDASSEVKPKATPRKKTNAGV